MALSKSTRIIILLVIDSLFFLLELVTGYAVHSLALVADSFHMLNDVLSLCVGLWAVKAANRTATPKMYTYGYQRAETLGALVNGVFLVALCVTIFLDAIQRFVEPQEVSNPVLVLVVGCLGLASNIVGLALFHDHGHSHGGGGHSHGPAENSVRDAEEGHAGHHHDNHDSSSEATAVSPKKTRRHSRSTSRGFPEDFSGPSQFRNSIIAMGQGRMDDIASEGNSETEEVIPEPLLGENEPLVAGTAQKISYGSSDASKHKSYDHADHKHAQSMEAGKGGGHSHGDLNMKGIFLHVMGDALGNIGVIASALIIWLTKFPGRFYFDPAISLFITCIILASAIPLCKAASRILLQAVPQGIEVDDIKDDIESLSGVDSCHHVHVWQLSDTKLVASLHVRVTFNFVGEGSQRYMALASAIRKCLHEYGIHSSTIQPEFHPESEDGSQHDNGINASMTGSMRGDTSCLLECGDDCGSGKSCCPPAGKADQNEHDHSGHGHSH